MKTNRRNFIQLASAALATVAMPLPSMATPNGSKLLKTGDAGPDENYWKMVRKQFPLNKNLVYLNNGTMGPSPYSVIESMQKGMMEADVDGSYGGWENTCKKLAAFVGGHEDEIALTRNVTEGINIVAQGLPLGKGDEVIMTTHEHVGNALPWINIQKQKGIIIRTFTPAPTADETLNRIAALINKRTKALAIPHIPCTQGQVLPAKRISKLGKEKGLFVFID
ncbi:MAG: aminotransferase class V-fold PLP-dependent enzyme, partial [Bacteroidota bacterium]